MNIFTPQSQLSLAELRELSSTRHRIMTSQSTKNIISVAQDSLLAAYMMTITDRDIGRELFFNLCMKGDTVENGIIPENNNWSFDYIRLGIEHVQKIMKEQGVSFPIYSGKTLISLMLPKTLNYTKKNDVRKDQPIVKIVKGVLIEGALNKSILGGGHNSLIHVLYTDYGKNQAINFINNCQFIPNEYLSNVSFSIGIEDCILNDTFLNNQKIKRNEINQFIEDTAYRAFIKSKTVQSTIALPHLQELKVCAILQQATDSFQKTVKDSLVSGKQNGFVDTVSSGCKGEYFNITQIMGMIGQQIHLGKRIEYTLNNGKRSLVHYPKESLTIEEEFESKGFIKHSFLHGMNPQEFIWHACAGREGCVSTAMNTANSGYTQRKVCKMLEGTLTKFDQTVRNVNNDIAQWIYGNDGFDRNEMCFKNGEPVFVDCERLADQLNNEFELN